MVCYVFVTSLTFYRTGTTFSAHEVAPAMAMVPVYWWWHYFHGADSTRPYYMGLCPD